MINYLGSEILKIKEKNRHINICVPEFKEIENDFYIYNINEEVYYNILIMNLESRKYK